MPIDSALADLRTEISGSDVFSLTGEQRTDLQEAVDRAAARLLGEPERAFTIALAGCSGAGKSTLINALAGVRIAATSDRRPCTMRTRVYTHRELPAGGLPEELAEQAQFVVHDRPELRHKALVDTPDLDTFHTENRTATRALLKAAGLVIYVFSPERYAEERAWSVIREEQRFSAAVCVVNKADAATPSEIAGIAQEIRSRFADMGQPDIRVLAVAAARHLPGASQAERSTVDAFPQLKAYIEHELQFGQMAELLRAQRRRVVAALAEKIQAFVPPDLADRLDAVERQHQEVAADAGRILADRLSERLQAVEAELEPLATLQAHARYWGPFRTYLATADFLRYGLPRWIRELRWIGSGEESSGPRRLLVAGKEAAAGDVLAAAAARVQDQLFDRELPVGPWHDIASRPSGETHLRRIAAEIQDRSETAANAGWADNAWIAGGVSLVGALVPSGLVVYALVHLFHDLWELKFEVGLNAVGLVLAVTLLFYLLLHGVVGLLLGLGGSALTYGLARQAVVQGTDRVVAGWFRDYRRQVAAAAERWQTPLRELEAATAGPSGDVRAGIKIGEAAEVNAAPPTSPSVSAEAAPRPGEPPEPPESEPPESEPRESRDPEDSAAPGEAEEPGAAARRLRAALKRHGR